MEQNFEKILFHEHEIKARIKQMGEQINHDYRGVSDVLFVPIMDGSLVFAAELLICLDFDVQVNSTKISSYAFETQSNEAPKILTPFSKELVQNKNVILVDDLIDTGHTLALFADYLKQMGAKSVKICVLFDKKVEQRQKEVQLDYVGFEIPDAWVAGFGVDSKEKFRNFRHFGIVKK